MAIEANPSPGGAASVAQPAVEGPSPDHPEPGVAANDSGGAHLVFAGLSETHRCHFSVYRADSVSVTSTQFSGGDWRWRLSDQTGAVLVQAAGYRSEALCREAVAILQARSARATVT